MSTVSLGFIGKLLNGDEPIGTAVLIGNNLALTAWHCIKGDPTRPFRVRFRGRPRPGVEASYAAHDEFLDLALLKLEAPEGVVAAPCILALPEPGDVRLVGYS